MGIKTAIEAQRLFAPIKEVCTYSLDLRKRGYRGAVFIPFPIYPPFGGGALRVLSQYKYVAAKGPTIFVFGVALNPADEVEESMISKNLIQIVAPKSEEFLRAEQELSQKLNMEAGISLGDIYFALLPEVTQKMFTAFLDPEWINSFPFIIFSHPYLWPALKAIIKRDQGRRPLIVYDAHNVEYVLKKRIYSALPKHLKDKCSELVFDCEGSLVEEADLIFCTSEVDCNLFRKIYSIPTSKEIVVIPNAVDLKRIKTVISEVGGRRAGARRCAVFVGSDHPPNTKAVEDIIRLAGILPEMDFVIIGSVKRTFVGRKGLPANVKFLGYLDDKSLSEHLLHSDVALAPISYGSGTEIKVITYLSHGIPVVATPVGVRGLSLVGGKHLLVGAISEFPKLIRKVLSDDSLRGKMVNNGMEFVKENYDSEGVAERIRQALKPYLVTPLVLNSLKKVLRFLYTSFKAVLFLTLPHFIFLFLQSATERIRRRIKEALEIK